MFEFITKVADVLDGKYAVAVSNYDRAAHYFTELGYPLSMVPKRYSDAPRVRVSEGDIADVRRIISANFDGNFFIGTVHGVVKKIEDNGLYTRFPPLEDKLVFVEKPYHYYFNAIRLGRANPEGLDMVPILIEYINKTMPEYIDMILHVGRKEYDAAVKSPRNPREVRQIEVFENMQRLKSIYDTYLSKYLGKEKAHKAFVEYLQTSGMLPK